MIHELKCWPEYFQPILTGEKTAELRKNDRHFGVGDVLYLREWEPTFMTEAGVYTGRSCRRRITHVLHGVGTVGAIPPLKGLCANYVMLSLRIPEAE